MKKIPEKKKPKQNKEAAATEVIEDGRKTKSSGRQPTLKLACNCNHAYQDREFGRGIRLFNHCGKPVSRKYRCTVCLKTVEV